MDDYIFRRELDLQTNLPEMIVHLKKDRQFRKMDIAKKKELHDEYYTIVKKHFLSEDIPDEKRHDIENTAMKQILERARQELKNTIH